MSKESLLQTIDLLEQESIDDCAYLILQALVFGLIWSEETDTAVRTLGTEIAQEIYDHSMQNAEREVYLNSPANPRNWKSTKKLG